MKKIIWIFALIAMFLGAFSAGAEEKIKFIAGNSSENSELINTWDVEHVIDVQDTDSQQWVKFSTSNKDEWVHIKVLNYSMVTRTNAPLHFLNNGFGDGINYRVINSMGEVVGKGNVYNTRGERVESYITLKLEKNAEYKIQFWFQGVSEGIFSVSLISWKDLLGETREEAFTIAPGGGIQKWNMSGWGDVDYINLGTTNYDRQATFYLNNFEFDTKDFKMSLYDSFGIKVDSMACKKGETAILKANLKKNEAYYLEIKVDHTEKLWFGNYNFGWCTMENHAPANELRVVKEASCTETGVQSDYCLICNEGVNPTELPALGHTPGGAVTVQEASCIRMGIQEVRCEECRALLESSELPMVSHIIGKMLCVKPATCTEAGLNEQHCTVCNITLSTETPAALGHTPGAWVDTLAATCTAEGVRTQYCETCHAVLATEAIPAHGHRAMEWQEEREAACLQSGLKEKKCSDCGVVLETEQINALGHRYTEWETILEATKELEGEKRRHCIHCGDTQFEKIEKLPKILGIF